MASRLPGPDQGTGAVTPAGLESVATSTNAEAAFEDCARALTPALMAYFIRRVDPVDDAADCVSETLMVLWRQRDRLPANSGRAAGLEFRCR